MESLTYKDKLKELRAYYKDTGLLIAGLNDSQGVKTTSFFVRRGLLEYLARQLSSDELTPQVINAFSLTMNKTEHIDYMLRSNLTIEEIKLSQVYSAVSAYKKVMQDLHLPESLGNIANIYRMAYKIKSGDENIRITDALKSAQESIVIYSSGVNNLMREVGSNPMAISGQYNARDIKPNYNYTLGKAKEANTLKKVMDSIERNFYNLLSINNRTNIYALGSYIPKSLNNEDMDIFRELIIAYNELLQNLCKEYGVDYINTGEIGNKYNNSEQNFHISTNGHKALAKYILSHVYGNKFGIQKDSNFVTAKLFKVTNKGAQGMIDFIGNDYREELYRRLNYQGFEHEISGAIVRERRREAKIFEQVLSHSKK